MTSEEAVLADQIAQLGREKAFYELGVLLAKQTEATLYQLVEDDLSRIEAAGAQQTLLLFKGGSALAERGQTQAGDTVLGAISSACVGQICEDNSSAEPDAPKWAVISDRLLGVLPQLGPRSIIDVAFRVLAELKTSGSLPAPCANFVPMLLDTLGAIGAVEITSADMRAGVDDSSSGGSVRRTGAELKAYWIESACTCKWHAQAAVRISAALRETALSAAQVERVAGRVLRQLDHVAELAELPAMVYQLLLLSRSGSKQTIVGGVLAYFDGLEQNAASEQQQNEQAQSSQQRWRDLGDTEGTVMLHIGYSIKQDFELGDALLAHASASDALSSFSFACVLSLARIHRFEKAATGALRELLLRGMHDRDMSAAAAWARPYLLVGSGSTGGGRLLRAVAERSAYGWDQVTQSLVHLCLTTLDSTSAKRSAFSASACAQAREACMRTLQTAFAGHEFVRGEIVGQIMQRVTFQTEGHERFLELLQRLARADTDALRPYASRIVDALDAVAVLAGATVERLVRAAAALFLDDASFRTSLLLVLRKVLFAHALDERRAALGGLFVLVDVAARAATANVSERQRQQRLAVLLEVVGLLRRSLTQQAEIRTAAYTRLAQLLDDPGAVQCAPLLQALHGIFNAEFAKYYQRDRAFDSPINFQLCVSPATHRVAMPIDAFLQCYAKLATRDAPPASGAAGSSAWADVCARLANAQLEDFELDADCDFTLMSAAGLRNHNTARLVIGSLDAAIAYALDGALHASGDPALVVELFTKFQRFADVLCTRSVDERGRRTIAGASELSQMTLPAVLRVLQFVAPDARRTDASAHALNTDATPHTWFVERVGRAGMWRANPALTRHLLDVALARVSSAAEPLTHAVLHLAYVAYSGALAHCTAAEQPAWLVERGTKGRSALLIAAEILAACSTMLSGRGLLDHVFVAVVRPQPQLFAFDADAPDAQPVAVVAQCAEQLMGALRTAVDALLALRPAMVRETVSLLAAQHTFALRLAHLCCRCADAPARAQLYRTLNETARWAFSLFGGDLPGDVALLRHASALLIGCQPFLQPESALAHGGVDLASSDQAEPPPVSRHMDDYEFGSLSRLVSSVCRATRLLSNEDGTAHDEDDEDDDETNLSVFTARTVPALVTVTVAWLRAELHQIDWAAAQLVSTMRRELATRPAQDDEDLHVTIRLERRICLRLHALSTLASQLLAARFAHASAGDQVLRMYGDLHRTFAQLTKCKLALTQVPVTEAYVDALALICTQLKSHADQIIVERFERLGAMNAEGGGAEKKHSGKKADKTGGAAAGKHGLRALLRSSTVVSSLVYQMEYTEKQVVLLGARRKTPLAHYLKRSSARDFRIRTADLAEPLLPTTEEDEQEMSDIAVPSPTDMDVDLDSNAEEEEEEDQNQDEPGGPRQKRLRPNQ
ncbi:hypothetical protein H4S02_000382 [Coemansia sp. RSA 2611]|nr:hypothetical protein IWW54_000459 [Coemansia sp. RSA 2705]KAJ2321955.1 hypothetical protein IWW52_000397 [Coemansia sp. RSA 2704]KAJ2369991.1 hypothetical protein H4S01_000664 [Coemansia sp. RSA 2610]KAJ2393163.1 hypothetical protein H4S02_000382 [Coemansia sp. RSA 2611]KAJ2737608.1 hypothetical protein H4R23_001714 [Coemansia sp. Cherry 401B]